MSKTKIDPALVAVLRARIAHERLELAALQADLAFIVGSKRADALEQRKERLCAAATEAAHVAAGVTPTTIEGAAWLASLPGEVFQDDAAPEALRSVLPMLRKLSAEDMSWRMARKRSEEQRPVA